MCRASTIQMDDVEKLDISSNLFLAIEYLRGYINDVEAKCSTNHKLVERQQPSRMV